MSSPPRRLPHSLHRIGLQTTGTFCASGDLLGKPASHTANDLLLFLQLMTVRQMNGYARASARMAI